MKEMKRTYVRPTSEVVELHVTNQLLAGSTGLENYNVNEEGDV